jgi:hypothetical protein
MKIGSLVVYIKDIGGWIANGINITDKVKRPTLNELYVVRDIREEEGKIGLLLEEIINQTFYFAGNGMLEPAFNEKHFAEVQPPLEIKIEELLHEAT